MAIPSDKLKKSLAKLASAARAATAAASAKDYATQRAFHENAAQDRMIAKLMQGVERHKEEQAAREQKEQQEKEEQEKKAKEERHQKLKHFGKAQAEKFGYRPLSVLKEIDAEEFTRLLISTRKPASKTNQLDIFDLARCYYHDIHVKKSSTSTKQKTKNLKRTFQRFEEISNLNPGYPPAQYRLALLLIEGIGVEPHPNNHQRAVNLLMTAARKGYVFAHTKLGFCYLKNIGVEPSCKNLMSAYHWYKGASELGDPEAEEGVNVCLRYLKLFGITPPKDNSDEDAVMNDAAFDVAAEYKHALALEHRGTAKRNLKDMEAAFLSFMKAALNGHDEAEERVVNYINLNADFAKDFINPYLASITPTDNANAAKAKFAEAKLKQEKAALSKAKPSRPPVTPHFNSRSKADDSKRTAEQQNTKPSRPTRKRSNELNELPKKKDKEDRDVQMKDVNDDASHSENEKSKTKRQKT